MSCAASLVIAIFSISVTILFYRAEPSYYFPHVPFASIVRLFMTIVPILAVGRLVFVIFTRRGRGILATEYHRYLRVTADFAGTMAPSPPRASRRRTRSPA